MTGPERPAPAALRRRERIRHIRQSVAAISAASFIALFAVIYVQMAAGKDPALGASTAAQSPSTSPGSASSDFATNSSGSATNGSSNAATDQPAAVMTGQS